MVKITTVALSFAALLGVLLVLTACVTSGGSFCAIESPRRPSQSEIATMSDRAIENDLAHNLKGQKLCGWKAGT